jgi:hypothetical protein
MRLVKTERSIKNGQSGDTGMIGNNKTHNLTKHQAKITLQKLKIYATRT